VVETSGLALPEPLIAALHWPEIRTRIRLHGVVAMVDGEALAAGSVVADPAALEAQRLADPSLDHASAIDELFAEQLEAADLVLMSRADCLTPDAMETVHRRLMPLLRPGAVVLPVARGNVDPELVLGLERRASNDRSHDPEGHHHDHKHHDHSHVAIEALALELPGAFRRQALEQQLAHLLRQSAVIRLKGRLWLPGKARPLQIQAVGPRLECWFDQGGAAPTDAHTHSPGLELVVLGFQLDQGAIEASLQQANLLNAPAVA
jgi:cobalamin biosynthesis protein CobW